MLILCKNAVALNERNREPGTKSQESRLPQGALGGYFGY